MPDVRELGQKVKAKYPGAYDDISDAELGRKVKRKYPGSYDDFTDTPVMATPPSAEAPQGIFQSFQTGVAGPLLRNVVETATDLYNRPLDTLERAGRAGLEFISAFDPAGNAYEPTVQSQAARMAELRSRAEAQRPEVVRSMERGMQQEEAKPRTKAGRIAFGAGRIAGEVAFPTAPENAVQNVIMAPFGGAAIGAGKQALRASVGAVRRTFGKGAAQIIEAEAAPAASAIERQATGEATPATGEVSPVTPQATPTVQNAMQQFEAEVQRINASNLTPRQKAIELETAIQRIGQEASGQPPGPGISAVSLGARRGFPEAVQQFPENPNPIQQSGILPEVFGNGEGPPPLGTTLEPPTFGVRAGAEPSYTETTGPSVRANFDAYNTPGAAAPSGGAPTADINAPWEAKWENQPLQQALIEGSRGIPTPLATRIKDELLGALGSVPKMLRSSIDVSAAGRQGLILSARPFQWRQFTKAWVNQFKAFKTKNFEAINQAIANHPDAGLMEESGLYLSNRAKEGLSRGEEAFFRRTGSVISEKVGNLPGIKQSEQAYTTFLDTQRVEAFQQYKNAIEKAGLPPEQAKTAYEAAARFINYATGRGSLGQKINSMMDGLNLFFFSPRYIASRLNILNPGMYIKNALTPGGRVVLRQQMGDLMQYLGMVGTTLYLAHLAGADVTLNPRNPDFGKIKVGSWRWDLGAGLNQTMRMMYGVGEDFKRALFKEKPVKESAIDIGKRFLEYKLSPPAGVVRDFFARKTLDKKPFTYGGAVADLTVPMQIADFVDAYLKEGFGGIAKTSFGEVGIGVQNYQQTPIEAAVERTKPLLNELQRLNLQVPELRKRGEGDKLEPDDIFNKRVQQFGQNYTLYGLKLLDNPRFQQAPDNVKALAVKRLGAITQGLTTKDFAFPELELDANTILDSVQSAEERKQERVRQRGF